MKTIFRAEPVTAFLALLWVATVAGAFFGGRMSKSGNSIDNSTNVIINNNYAVSMSSSASASVAIGQAESNVNLNLNFEVTNMVFELSNSMTNDTATTNTF